jgi:hypothetical protein
MFAYSTGMQQPGVANAFQLVNFTTGPIIGGWSLLGNAGGYTGFIPTNTGVYCINYSACVTKTTGNGTTNTSSAIATFNGAEIAGSESSAASPGDNIPFNFGNSFFITISPTGILAFEYAATSVNGSLTPTSLSGSATSAYPTSFTTSITRVQ